MYMSFTPDSIILSVKTKIDGIILDEMANFWCILDRKQFVNEEESKIQMPHQAHLSFTSSTTKTMIKFLQNFHDTDAIEMILDTEYDREYLNMEKLSRG